MHRPTFQRRAVSGPLAFCFAFLCIALSCRAQQTAYTLSGIKFVGLDHYSEQQAEFASQLKVGAPATLSQIQAASDRLAQSGAFDKISYRYTTRGSELAVEFQITETKNRLTAVFDNFVWFSADEIDRVLRTRVPLYDGTVPERGTTSYEVSDALRQMLQANGISGTVDGLPTLKNGKYTDFAYRVSGVGMPVKAIQIPGASAVPETELVAAAKELIGKDYSGTDAEYVEELTLLAIYHRRGYLQARFDRPQASVIGNVHSGASFDIALTMPVNEGAQFSWDHGAWSGNQTFSTDELNGFLAMKPHEIANQDKINAGLRAVANALSKRGFIDALVQSQVSLDESTRMVAYQTAIDEGIQYKMGQLHITGLADKISADLIKKWQIKPGQIYDGTYLEEFMKKVVAQKLADSGKSMGTVDEKIDRDKQNATVDLILVFR
jgi:outer membrane protein assembly factor BamA